MKNSVKTLLKILIVGVFALLLLVAIKLGLDKQVKVDCLKAERHNIIYNVPIAENLDALCIEEGYY